MHIQHLKKQFEESYTSYHKKFKPEYDGHKKNKKEDYLFGDGDAFLAYYVCAFIFSIAIGFLFLALVSKHPSDHFFVLVITLVLMEISYFFDKSFTRKIINPLSRFFYALWLKIVFFVQAFPYVAVTRFLIVRQRIGLIVVVCILFIWLNSLKFKAHKKQKTI